MEFSLAIVALTIATFLLAGFVKGVIGLGLPSIAIGLLAIAMPPAQAALLMIVPSLVTNAWQMFAGPYLPALLRRTWLLLVGCVIGVWFGGGIITSTNSRYAALGLGIALVVYGIVGLSGVRFSVRREAEWWWSFPVGLATGLITGATGVFVLPAGVYFQAIGLEKDELVQMLGISFTVSTVALAVILWRDGVMQFGNTAGSALAVVPALIGMLLGQRIRMRASPETFRKWFFMGMLALGLQQAIRNMF
jgi:uncharacterized protein